jgi:hypothetical protein
MSRKSTYRVLTEAESAFVKALVHECGADAVRRTVDAQVRWSRACHLHGAGAIDTRTLVGIARGEATLPAPANVVQLR